tara:strand:+ start:3599 stop:4633 length:1035 start_codon:yes stop_codon:yes gene_type:complete
MTISNKKDFKKLKEIPVMIESGSKYKDSNGTIAIKDGVKKNSNTTSQKKPKWIRISAKTSEKFKNLQQVVHEKKLSTVCEEAKCPNINECWSHGTATIMLLGSVCTRACKFCSVDTGNPHGFIDTNEIENSYKTVEYMGLKYIVITSVDRDDIPDGGAKHYADTIKYIKLNKPDIKIEALTPDFQGRLKDIETIVNSRLDVFAQNIETVKRLTHKVRDIRAGYEQTLKVLAYAKEYSEQNLDKLKVKLLTKTSLMLGLGETFDEIIETMDDLRKNNVDILTLGQYLQPTKNHLPVDKYISPKEFTQLREIGLQKGFLEVASGPLVRSSYRAERVFEQNNLGQKF